MLNPNMLRGKIVERGFSIASVSEAMHINKSTFYRKLSGDCEFTIRDADMLVNILSLSLEEARAIFFSQIVA